MVATIPRCRQNAGTPGVAGIDRTQRELHPIAHWAVVSMIGHDGLQHPHRDREFVMSLLVTCQFCGVRLRARSGFAGSRGECPGCGRVIVLPSEDQPSATSHSTVSTYKLSDAPQQQDADAIPITEFLDPPGSPTASVPQSSIPIARRMFEALLDPHSIQ